MTHESTPTRLRGVVKNAVLWGVTWGALGTTYASIRRLADDLPLLNAIGDGLGMGIRIGIVGALAGAAFAAFVSVAYRRRKLSDISAVRFGIGGAVLASLFVLLFMQGMNLLSGDAVPWHLITDDIVMATLFGGITAGGTMKLAQRSAAETTYLLDTDEPPLLSEGAATEFRAEQRARSAERF